MKTIAILMFLFSGALYAQENPMDKCEELRTNFAYLTCRISVLDDYLAQSMSKADLKKVKAKVKEECSTGGMPGVGFGKVDPKLRRLANLQCEDNIKVQALEDVLGLSDAMNGSN